MKVYVIWHDIADHPVAVVSSETLAIKLTADWSEQAGYGLCHEWAYEYAEYELDDVPEGLPA